MLCLILYLLSFNADTIYLVLANGQVVETKAGFEITESHVVFHDMRDNLLQVPREQVNLQETEAYNKKQAQIREAALIGEAMKTRNKPKDMADLLELNPKPQEEDGPQKPLSAQKLYGTWRNAGSEDVLHFSEGELVFHLLREGQRQRITASWRLDGDAILLIDLPGRDPRDPPVKLSTVVSLDGDTLILKNAQGTHRYYR